jgi:DnaK suppressor protein
MLKKELEKIKNILEKEKTEIENQLSSFAKKSKKIKDEWKTKFPVFDKTVGSERLEEAQDEVEAFSNLLAIEANLEKRLKDINIALEKIEKGVYGKCEKCKKEISLAKLKANPSTKVCTKCK